ncbi:MAG: DegT/DnrJ/EryC1/StrS family aminotransferase [Candidatus Levybacteria bacterium]|nr:DegT/DnrJ/EryC1/StrS family aminotransferase [Candidatus Levybacteria bacterium]
MKKRIGKRLTVPLAKPYFSSSEESRVREVLRSGWVTQGPAVAAFEEVVGRYTDAKYAVATTSATTALFLSLYLLGIGPGDEVITPSFTFIASTNVIMHVGANPVFVDIDPSTYNIDVSKIAKKITKKTKAILSVDQFGLPCDYDLIRRIAEANCIYHISDAACALGSLYKGKRVGGITDITCLSFHPRKVITTGEGGMIVTNKKSFAQKAKILRHHGMSVSDLVRHHASVPINESYTEIGFNFRMSDVQAGIGNAQMEKIGFLLKKRAAIAEKYTRAFRDSTEIIPPYVPSDVQPNWQSYIIRLTKGNRDEVMRRLLVDGIATRRGNLAVHQQEAYRGRQFPVVLPETEKAAVQTLALPIFPQLTKHEQDYVIEKLLFYAKKSA